MLKIFRVETPEGYDSALARLSLRQRTLLAGAVTYHSLINPGRRLHYQVYVGGENQYPRLTDTSTLDGVNVEGLVALGEFDASGIAPHRTDFTPRLYAGNIPVRDRNIRYILLTPDTASDDVTRSAHGGSPVHRLYSELERHAPAVLDAGLSALTTARIAGLKRYVPRRRVESPQAIARRMGVTRPICAVAPGPCVPNAAPAALIGMHWLQAGGAERWAVETVALARAAGLRPIVVTDHDSHSPWITRAELDGALIIPLTFPAQEQIGDEPFLRAIFEAFDIRGVWLHHSQWLYDRLPWVKQYRPKVPIIDSLHILEYKGGGFPAAAVHEDAFIDAHHVISPQLKRWMIETQKVSSEKVVLAPLGGLTSSEGTGFRARTVNGFTVSFIGRLARQKRPELFLRFAKRASERFPEVRFVMHGDGELDEVIGHLIDQFGLSDVVTRRSGEVPISDTLVESDLLLITSINEGITLTTFEAVAAGVPVVSSRVGSQGTLIPPEGLLPYSADSFLRHGLVTLERLLTEENQRRSLWKREREAVTMFDRLQTATSWAKGQISTWAQK